MYFIPYLTWLLFYYTAQSHSVLSQNSDLVHFAVRSKTINCKLSHYFLPIPCSTGKLRMAFKIVSPLLLFLVDK